MKDSTKQFLIVFLPCFLFGLFAGIFGNHLKPELYLLGVFILILVIIFLSKKLTSKALKNDEIIKKVAVMSDAVSARSTLVIFFIYMLLDFTGHISYLPALETKHWFMFLFLIMGFSALIASIYYSRNPHKLP